MKGNKKYAVRAISCDHRASDQEVYAALKRATLPLERSWGELKKADKIFIKVNMVWPPERIQYFAGRYRELVDPVVMEGVIRLLQEETGAELAVIDTTLTGTESDVYFKPLLERYDVEFINASDPPLRWYDVPGGGLIFSSYLLSARFEEADALVSVAKMKNHASTGITLTTKNLFGLSPLPPEGRSRSYFHHPVRLPYAMADLGRILAPALNIVDGLVGQSGREWGGQGRIGDMILAGDHVTATDAFGSFLMGHDPHLDWPEPPFRRERNYVMLAANSGDGTVDLEEIDIESEVEAPVSSFNSVKTDPPELIKSWRKTACEQGLIFRDRRQEMIEKYAHEYIYLQAGEVVWHGKRPGSLGSRRQLSGDKKDQALWLKYVDPEDREGEHFEVYEKELSALAID